MAILDKTGKIRRLTAPETEPVTRDEAKAHLRVESAFTEDDAYIDGLIKSARDHVEKYTGRAWATADFIWTIEDLKVIAFGEDLYQFKMPMPYVSAIDEIAYLDHDNTEQIIDTVDLDVERQRVTIPATVDSHDWRIKFTAGSDLGANGSKILPEAIKQAICLLIGDAYDNRQASVLGVSITENPAVISLMHDYRVNMGV